MFVVHPARIKCHAAQVMVTQDFSVEVLKFLRVTQVALLSKAGGTVNSRDIIWNDKALARGDVTMIGSHCFIEYLGRKIMRC